MKKVKKYLNDLMLIELEKQKMKEIIDQYPNNAEDEDLSINDLRHLKNSFQIITNLNKKNNLAFQDEDRCIKNISKILESKQCQK